jgi:two-component system, cell cycle response regulator DivK
LVQAGLVKATILIVEDNQINRQLMTDLLEFHNYRVIEAPDGTRGIELAREQMPDLIIMDMQMPVMDGFEAISILKTAPETRDIKIMAITSFAMKGDREKILRAGADYYMPKPINIREFAKVVRSLVQEKGKKST